MVPDGQLQLIMRQLLGGKPVKRILFDMGVPLMGGFNVPLAPKIRGISIETGCYDSDGGFDIFEKGTAIDGAHGNYFIDYCEEDSNGDMKLVEAICSNDGDDDGTSDGQADYYNNEQWVSCPIDRICFNGACVIDTICGNGVVGKDEECDDGNLIDEGCIPNYKESCSYCDSQCNNITIAYACADATTKINCFGLSPEQKCTWSPFVNSTTGLRTETNFEGG